MRCDGVKELLYEFIKGELKEDNLRMVEEHIKSCDDCRGSMEKMRYILSLLDEVKPPPLSENFNEKVIQRIHKVPLPPKPLLQQLRELIQVPYIKWPLRGLSAAAVILFSLTIYKSLTPEKPHEIEKIPRKLEITLAEVKNPIIIEIEDIDKTFDQLKEVIQAHNGQLLRTVQVDKGLKITFSLKKEEEPSLFTELNKLGKVQMEKEGYKNQEGNIVVLLKKR